MADARTTVAIIGVILLAGSAASVGLADANPGGMMNLEDLAALRGDLGIPAAPSNHATTSSLLLIINEDTNQAWLKNDSPTVLQVIGYTVESLGGYMDYSGWESLTNAAITRPDDVIDQLGPGALHFFEGQPDLDTFLGEGNISHYAAFQPGASWYIGRPMTQASLADLRFVYALYDHTVHEGGIDIVPEPTTLSLLALGGLAMLRRRRKR